jgi:hypothetical protein
MSNQQQSTALTVPGASESNTQVSIYSNMHAFEEAQRVAKALASSDMVPEKYKGRLDNVLVSLELANRMQVSPLMVMQNLDIIQGKPSFSAKFLLARLNSCGQFSPIRYKERDLGEKTVTYSVTEWVNNQKTKKQMTVAIQDMECIAIARDISTGEILQGPKVTIEMAVKEGWYGKSDSKWQTMPDLMLKYRAAAFFQRLYAPELSMGMNTTEEVIDITPITIESEPVKSAVEEVNSLARGKKTQPAKSTKIVSRDLTENQSSDAEDII